MMLLVCVIIIGIVCTSGFAQAEYKRHTNNWAVIIDTSRFWFNYRHIANALSLYHSVKKLGIPDSQIILMLADQMPCNPRNCFPGQVFNNDLRDIELYGENVEVDYRGSEVTVENFIKVLTGRHDPGTPASRRLDTDEHSNVFIYMTGHGGEEFIKFQDYDELSSPDIADAIQEMHVKKRYNELFYMVDTCQAGSLANSLKSPNVITIGSSKTGENSYAHHSNSQVGVSVIDRFTSATLDFLDAMEMGSKSGNATLHDLFSSYNPYELYSTPDYRTDMLKRSIKDVPLTDFLGSVLHVVPNKEVYPLEGSRDKKLDNNDRFTFSALSDDRPFSIYDTKNFKIDGTGNDNENGMQISGNLFISCALFGLIYWVVSLKINKMVQN